MRRFGGVARLAGAAALGLSALIWAGNAQAEDTQPRKNEAVQYKQINYGDGLKRSLCALLYAEEARLSWLKAVSKAEAPYAVLADLEVRLGCLPSGLGQQLKDAGKADRP